MAKTITVNADIKASVKKVWDLWIGEKHIVRWNNASADWHSPKAKNDVKAGGKFNIRMESKDGKEGFDFEGTYTRIEPLKKIIYEMSDGRRVKVEFINKGKITRVKETFDPERINPESMQREGWQSILNNFKKYAEGKN